ncbi:hypothetical protein HK104_001900 [Borealophlyctis nickersoniae]|nr:hypothetical protein HK104_001900 [Borealophlyctis nickersoniae]
MHLFYEVVFDMSPYQNEYANGRTPDLVWAMGDYTGYGLHADFMNGWDKNVLQAAIDQCTSPSGVIEECKPFQLYVGTEMRDCKLDRSLGLNEVVTGTIPQLLIGGNKVAKRGLERRGRH